MNQSGGEAVREQPPKRKAPEPVPVTAALIENDGHILIGKRKRGHFAGRWEFPGGKVEEGETPEECLRRELHEELGVETRVGTLFLSTVHAYHHVTIELLTYKTEILSGEIVLRDHTETRWVPLSDLSRYDFPEADKPVIEKLTEEAASGLVGPQT
jgi:8-oxo-dGTP diphosphatase